MLRRMHSGFQRGCPAGCVYTCASVLRAFDGLPINHEGDSIFGLWHTVVWLARRNPRRCTRNNASRVGDVLQNPGTDINVVRGEIVTCRPRLAAVINMSREPGT